MQLVLLSNKAARSETRSFTASCYRQRGSTTPWTSLLKLAMARQSGKVPHFENAKLSIDFNNFLTKKSESLILVSNVKDSRLRQAGPPDTARNGPKSKLFRKD